jgi:hypothetical protein
MAVAFGLGRRALTLALASAAKCGALGQVAGPSVLPSLQLRWTNSNSSVIDMSLRVLLLQTACRWYMCMHLACKLVAHLHELQHGASEVFKYAQHTFAAWRTQQSLLVGVWSMRLQWKV